MAVETHHCTRLIASALMITGLTACGGDDEQALVDLTEEELQQLCSELDDAIAQDEPARQGACARGGALLAFRLLGLGDPNVDVVAECETFRQLCLRTDRTYVCPRSPWRLSDDCSAMVPDLDTGFSALAP
jgi:hypothetical protein